MPTPTVDEAFRDYVTDGVPASGPYKPQKSTIRQALAALRDDLRALLPQSVRTFGAVGSGLVDDLVAIQAAVTAAAGRPIYFPPGTYMIGSDATIAADMIFSLGAKLKLTTGVDLTITGRIDAPDDGRIFTYPSTASLSLTGVARVPLGWFDADGDATDDVSYFINNMIASAPANGREISIPFGSWLLNSPISIGQKNFIHLAGSGAGMRSDGDYQKAAPAGIGGSATWPGGGAQLCCGQGCSSCVLLPASGVSGLRVSGITISGLTFSGHVSATVDQRGFDHENDSDNTVVRDCVFEGFLREAAIHIGVSSDTCQILNNWCAENKVAIRAHNGVHLMIANNQLGGNHLGLALDIYNHRHATITGNHVFTLSAVLLLIANCLYPTIVGNVWNSLFTGLIVWTGTHFGVVSGNFFRCPIDTNTSWTAGKDFWSSSPYLNYDPLNRDTAYGMVQIQSGDLNQWTGNVFQHNMPANSVAVRVKTGAGNRFSGNRFVAAAGSTKHLSVEAAAVDTRIIDCTASGNVENSAGSQTTIQY